MIKSIRRFWSIFSFGLIQFIIYHYFNKFSTWPPTLLSILVRFRKILQAEFQTIIRFRDWAREMWTTGTEGCHYLANRIECKWKGENKCLFQGLPRFHWSHYIYISLNQSTIACALEQHLLHLKKFTYRLDGDNIRFGLNNDLGFDEQSRNENIRRIGEVSCPMALYAGWSHRYGTLYHRSPSCSRMLLLSR